MQGSPPRGILRIDQRAVVKKELCCEYMIFSYSHMQGTASLAVLRVD